MNQDLLNKEYQRLCSILGDLKLKQSKIEKAIAETVSQIEGLDHAAGLLKKLSSKEDALKDFIEKRQKETGAKVEVADSVPGV